MRSHPLVVLLSAAIVCAGATDARAQQLVGPTFNVGMVETVSLATGFDGSVVAIATPFDGSATRALRYAGGHAPLVGSNTLLADTNRGVRIAPLARGGYAVVWPQFVGGANFDVYVQRLGPDGKPLGLPAPAALDQPVAFSAGIAPHGDGFVVAWENAANMYGRAFDGSGSAIGGPFLVGVTGAAADIQLRATPSGGFLAVWGADGGTRARVFGPDLVPLGPTFDVTQSFKVNDVAVNPSGTVAAIVGVPLDQAVSPKEVRLCVFALDASSVSDDIVVRTVAGNESLSTPAVAFGAGGDLVVVWGERPIGVDSVYSRLFDATGAVTGPVKLLTNGSGPGLLRTTRRADGAFFTTWIENGRTLGAVMTLCTPFTSVCGDGVLTSTCEVCDAGGGNSDSAPDACRSDCRPARCGDGVADSGEECDDGNGTACDGCNQFCELETGTVCGDGVLAPLGCHEACDDANAVAGDGCSPVCFVERIPGGGSPSFDCYAAWRMDNASNEPRYDKRGYINGKQNCRDNDPACDFDGGVVGSCTFHVAVCVNNTEPAECTPARLQSWALRTPSEKQAEKRPELAAARAVLAAAVVPSVVGSSDPDLCSPNADLVVPLRGDPGGYRAGKLKLKSTATVYSGAVDTDALALRCDP